MSIRSWPQFAARVRKGGRKLLRRLPEFDDPLLIAGCQRSGTTMMTRLMIQSEGFADYRRDEKFDSELEGALILSGRQEPHILPLRYCFQTTFLNENYAEYFEHKGRFKMIFVIRNPYSVVYSMCYHWKRRRDFRNFALNELFLSCGLDGLTEKERKRLSLLGTVGVSKLRKACLSYVGKTAQVFECKEKLGADVLIVDYEDVIERTGGMLSAIFSFIDMPYDRSIEDLISSKSLKRYTNLTEARKACIRDCCLGVYERASALKFKP